MALTCRPTLGVAACRVEQHDHAGQFRWKPAHRAADRRQCHGPCGNPRIARHIPEHPDRRVQSIGTASQVDFQFTSSNVVERDTGAIKLVLPGFSATDLADVEEVAGTCGSTTFAMTAENSGRVLEELQAQYAALCSTCYTEDALTRLSSASFTFTAGNADLPAHIRAPPRSCKQYDHAIFCASTKFPHSQSRADGENPIAPKHLLVKRIGFGLSPLEFDTAPRRLRFHDIHGQFFFSPVEVGDTGSWHCPVSRGQILSKWRLCRALAAQQHFH